MSKKKLDLCLRSNGKDILYDVIPNDLSSIKSWLTRTFEKFFLSEDSLVGCLCGTYRAIYLSFGLCNKKYRSLLMFGRCS